MDLEGLFNRYHHRKHEYHNHKSKHRSHNDRYGENRYTVYDRDHRDEDDEWYPHGVRKYNHHNTNGINLSHLVPHLLAHKKILISAGIAVVAVIVIAVTIVLAMFGQALAFISKSGLQGVIDRLLQSIGVV